MKTYFNSFSLDSLESDIEDYGRECYDEGYEEGYYDGLHYEGEDVNRLEDLNLRGQGLIKRTHNYNGQIVHVWIRG